MVVMIALHLQPDAGHAVNLHYSASNGYALIRDFVRRSGFEEGCSGMCQKLFHLDELSGLVLAVM